MCGILGSFFQQPPSGLNERLQSALSVLHHRGPNDSGLEHFPVAGGQLSLGHTRLSIIDLTPGGHQPMHSLDGRYTLVFNGEIYNYKELRNELKGLGNVFHTDSDTEVLLAAWAQWGADALRRLVGMFAFAVFDRVDESLTLVRDAFGIKPLFYSSAAEGPVFASEIPAILKILSKHPELNLQRAYDYLVFGAYDSTADTFYQDIHHLLPGHWLKFDLKTSCMEKPGRWWWPSIKERTDLSFDDAALKLREMFLNNVRLHLRSDVPLGAALSGGVDSSAVVCAMRHLEPGLPIHTFSFIARGSDADEEVWADLVNTHVGAIPHKVIVDPRELGSDLDDMLKAQGEPFGSTSIYAQYRVFRLARENAITVTLDGQGADELLAGYNGYPYGYLRSMLENRCYHKIPGFLNAWTRWPGRSWGDALRILTGVLLPIRRRKLVRKLVGCDHSSPPAWIDRRRLTDLNIDASYAEPYQGENEGRGRRLAEQLREALTVKGLSSLLRHGDRNSMRWSIESRVPFLTTDMAEFLLSLPESYLLSPTGETKSVFRAAMRGIVPDAILDRRDKIGFQTPERAWLQGQKNEIQNWLTAADDLPFLNSAVVRKDIEEMLEGKRKFTPHTWRLINYCRWVRLQNIDGVKK